MIGAGIPFAFRFQTPNAFPTAPPFPVLSSLGPLTSSRAAILLVVSGQSFEDWFVNEFPEEDKIICI